MGSSYSATGLVWTNEERLTLIRRTYTLVFFSILVTMVGSAFTLTQPAVFQAVEQNLWLTYICAFVPLIAARVFRNRFPLNIGMVFLFTFAMGVAIAPLLFIYNTQQPGILLQAGGLTITTFAALTAYAFISRRNFSALGGFFTIGLWVLIGTSLLNMFFQNATANLWIAAATILVFSGLLVFDTWRLRHVYGPDDYVMAAVQIYLDLLNLFVGILTVLGGGRRN
jgi:FtsH-binding integral membrane protein